MLCKYCYKIITVKWVLYMHRYVRYCVPNIEKKLTLITISLQHLKQYISLLDYLLLYVYKVTLQTTYY